MALRSGKPFKRSSTDKEPLILTGPANQVTSKDIRPGAVRGQHIAPGAVGSRHLANEDVFGEPEAWQNAVLSNSWENWGDTFAQVAFRKDQTGRVNLRGVLRGPANSGTATALQILTLPTGYRPTNTLVFWTNDSSTTGLRIDVYASGIVEIVGTALANVNFPSLDGISFHTDQ